MSRPARQNPAAPQGFEQCLEQVEQIIARIEAGEIGLEQSIAEYERGVVLIRQCRETLQKAEQRVKDLTAQMQAGESPGPARSAPAEPGDEDAPF